MRKDNPPVENPILSLMDKRKKKLHFRYQNTDFVNYESLYSKINPCSKVKLGKILKLNQ